MSIMKKIYFAGGCFWGVEHFFSLVKGVLETKVGYANSNINNPSYEDLKKHISSASETVEIIYDENIISLKELLELFFYIVDPTTLDKQGHDIGHQYRSGIYYVDEEEKEIINNYIDNIRNNYKDEIVTEVLKLENFYDAEEYHQNYLIKNPSGYCHIGLNAFEYAKKFK